MPTDPIAEDIVRIALDRVKGFPFERFAKAPSSHLADTKTVGQTLETALL